MNDFSKLAFFPFGRMTTLSPKQTTSINETTQSKTYECVAPPHQTLENTLLQNTKQSIFINGKMLQISTDNPISIVPISINTQISMSGNGQVVCYRGILEFRTDTNANFINVTTLENYIAGIAEMPGNWSIEALKAQAIVARSYSINLKHSDTSEYNEKHYHYDIDNSTAYQAYEGVIGVHRALAAQLTKAQTLTYQGNAIRAYYSANNGGTERNNQQVLGNPSLPYLPTQSDSDGVVQFNNILDPDGVCTAYFPNMTKGEFFRPANPANWISDKGTGTNGIISINDANGNLYQLIGISQAFLEGKSKDELDSQTIQLFQAHIQEEMGTIKQADFQFSDGMRISSSESSQQILSLLTSQKGNTNQLLNIYFIGTKGTLKIPAKNFVASFNFAAPGNDYLVSPLWFFTLQDKTATFYTFGYGHGVGMSQCGAEGRASVGQNAYQILSFYYPKTKLHEDSGINDKNERSCVKPLQSITSDACIRVGIKNLSSDMKFLQVQGDYMLYSGTEIVYQGTSNDKIIIYQAK